MLVERSTSTPLTAICMRVASARRALAMVQAARVTDSAPRFQGLRGDRGGDGDDNALYKVRPRNAFL